MLPVWVFISAHVPSKQVQGLTLLCQMPGDYGELLNEEVSQSAKTHCQYSNQVEAFLVLLPGEPVHGR